MAGAARWAAIAIAAAAVIDPPVPLPTRGRPAVRVLAGASQRPAASVSGALTNAGFAVNTGEPEAAAIIVGDHLPAALRAGHLTSRPERTPVWALDTTPPAPGVRIVTVAGPAARVPGQAVEIRVSLDARGLAGQTSEIVLEDAGIVVASARHAWKAEDETWRASLHYLPPGVAGGRLVVKIGGQVADVGVPPMRGPIRTLVVEAGVTWPALFVRRAIEGEPAFAVSAVQRATTRFATRAGAPPSALTRDALAPYEVALVGGPDNLRAGDVDALRWFVEARGGVAVVIPGERPTGRYLDLLGGTLLEPRALEAAVSLGGDLVASELLVAPRLPAAARTLAATDAGEPVVFSVRRGAGAVIFSGALDAWRYRAQPVDAFARFWRRAIAEEASAVAPVLEVTVDPPLVAAGAPARVRASLRATELSAGVDSLEIDTVTARAVSPGARVDAAVRLWPTAEPGVYEGEWRPSVPGDYDITVTVGGRRGDAPATAAATLSHASTADPEALALAARTSGGRVFAADQSAALVDAMKRAFPARTSVRTMNPMRSSWWVVPFAALLCAEWALRRRRGLP